MCVIIMEDGGKTIELPKMVITARRVSALELEVILKKITLVWNANTLSFDRFDSEPDINIVTVDSVEIKPETPPSPYVQIEKIEEASQVIIDNQIVVNLFFTYSDNTTNSGSYIYANGRYWSHHQGRWFSTASWFPPQNGWVEENGPPPANITPPEGPGGGDDGEIIGAN